MGEKAAGKAKMIKEKEGTGTHRMTRKKRRIREAREAAAEMMEEYYDGPEIQSELSQKQIAREHKREQSEREVERRDMSIHDHDVRKAKKQKLRMLQRMPRARATKEPRAVTNSEASTQNWLERKERIIRRTTNSSQRVNIGAAKIRSNYKI